MTGEIPFPAKQFWAEGACLQKKQRGVGKEGQVEFGVYMYGILQTCPLHGECHFTKIFV